MARIRTIKPEFFTSEDIVELSPFARLLYIALWCEADREGRLSWKPRTFKMRYFPGDDIDIEATCEELLSRRLVVIYGEAFAHIPTFLEHQHINPREAQSTLPSIDACPTRAPRVSDAHMHVSDAQVGRKGKEGKESNDASSDAGFLEFWSVYPRRVAKADAEKAWRKLKADDDLLKKILDAVSTAAQSDDWQKDGGKFIPYPASWLNSRRWEDEQGELLQKDPYDPPPGITVPKGAMWIPGKGIVW